MKTQIVREEDICVDQALESWINLIESLLRKHKYVKAEDAIRWALSMSPRCGRLWLELGSLMLMLKQFSEAEKCFTEAIKLNPENEQARRSLITLTAKRI